MALIGSLDTNIVLRLLLNDIPEQHNAAVKLLRSAGGQFAVADIVITELVFVLSRHYGLTRDQISEAVYGFMQQKQINCNRTLFENALPLFVNHSSLSFEDCCLATYAKLNDALPLYTFDNKLSLQADGAKLL